LLQVHQGKTDREVADNLGVNLSTVERTRGKFVHSTTLEEALNDRPHPPKPRKLDAKAEALLIATACSNSNRETLRERLMEFIIHYNVSAQPIKWSYTVAQMQKKFATNL
jgi:transposase